MTGGHPSATARHERQHRLFFALWPTEALRAELGPRIRALQPVDTGRPQRPDQWHVTLAFLGSVPAPRVEEARGAAAEVQGRGCEIHFDSVEHWRRPEVLCLVARVLPPPLADLVEQLRSALTARGFELDLRPFRAHLTLARKVPQPVTPAPFDALCWPATEFALVESITDRSGSNYQPLASWPLGT